MGSRTAGASLQAAAERAKDRRESIRETLLEVRAARQSLMECRSSLHDIRITFREFLKESRQIRDSSNEVRNQMQHMSLTLLSRIEELDAEEEYIYRLENPRPDFDSIFDDSNRRDSGLFWI